MDDGGRSSVHCKLLWLLQLRMVGRKDDTYSLFEKKNYIEGKSPVRPSVHKSFENHRPCVHASILVAVNTIFGGVSPANFYSSPTSANLNTSSPRIRY